jgi:hypothetical protein
VGKEPVRRSVPLAGAFPALDDGKQPGRQFLAQFHAPLIECIDAEQRRLDEDPMLVERQKPPQGIGVERAVDD